MEKLNNYANALSNLTYFVSSKFVNEIVEGQGTTDGEPFKFFYTILLKSNSALDTCALLLNNYFSRPHHVDSLAIILRSIISDCVVYRFLLEQNRGEITNEKLLSNINSIYFDHVDYTVKGLTGYFKEIYDWTELEVQQEVTAVKHSRPNYYDSDGKVKIEKFLTSVRAILREMAKRREVGDKIDLQKLYHHYDILSKYEHIGELSFELVHRQYSEATRLRYLDEIVDAINHSIIPTVISIVGAWPELWEKNKEQFNSLFQTVLATYEKQTTKGHEN